MFTGAYSGSVGHIERGPLPTYGEARARLLEGIAARLGKPAGALVGWVDYDPISLDESAIRQCRGQSGGQWAGD